MRIDVLTLFPRMFDGPMKESIIGKAIEKKLLEFNAINFREFSTHRHQNVDDYPYGGGAGMLLMAQPIFGAVCGHYEGYDERIRELVTDEISLGDYVLTGGELGAMVIVDATVRLLPDVLGNQSSAMTDSHSTGLLEHPQYTRPAEFRGMEVPHVLTNGNHKLIREWQEKESLRRTYQRRPDMLKEVELSKEQKNWLKEIKAEEDDSEE